MNDYKNKDLENILIKLIEYANNKNKDLKNKNSYIEFIYKKISQYLISIDPYEVLIHMDSYVQIIYSNEKYKKKIYRLFCPWYGKNEFYIPENINNIKCTTINFKDIIEYYNKLNKKEELINIKKSIYELNNQGLSLEEIENEIKYILNEVKENNKQKIKTL